MSTFNLGAHFRSLLNTEYDNVIVELKEKCPPKEAVKYIMDAIWYCTSEFMKELNEIQEVWTIIVCYHPTERQPVPIDSDARAALTRAYSNCNSVVKALEDAITDSAIENACTLLKTAIDEQNAAMEMTNNVVEDGIKSLEEWCCPKVGVCPCRPILQSIQHASADGKMKARADRYGLVPLEEV